ncbi:MAG: nuclear transport factor 2 family protein [Burkholderiaceae bacterium]|nr:nuclear transport factor 2 family protein [Burkholderiaceae bacterium]
MTETELFEHILALDEARVAATLAGDVARLEPLIGSSLRYVHSSGTDEDRSLYLERVGGGFYDYQRLTSIVRAFRRFGEVVLVNGDVEIDVVVREKGRKQFRSRYLQVWALENGSWRMVSWQSTPLPA